MNKLMMKMNCVHVIVGGLSSCRVRKIRWRSALSRAHTCNIHLLSMYFTDIVTNVMMKTRNIQQSSPTDWQQGRLYARTLPVDNS